MSDSHFGESGCGCCRREFLGTVGAAAGAVTLRYASLVAAGEATPAGNEQPATVRAVFLYPPSATLRAPGAWWSWPGNDFDAEGRQEQYTKRLKEIEQKLGMRILVDKTPLHSEQAVTQLIGEVKQAKLDGLLVIPFHNRTFHHIDRIVGRPEFISHAAVNG